MLQQTRIETILRSDSYANWLEKFPDEKALAEASEDEVLKAWEGLGYYRRARNLQRAARAIVERHDGRFPREWEAVRALPGVGDYTAGAVVAFAYDEAVPMVDGNVGRVLARLFDYREPVDGTKGKRQLSTWSGELVDPANARSFQSALMELGQRICTARAPRCGSCPVSSHCATRDPDALPVKRGKVEVTPLDEWVLWLREGDRVYLERETGSRRHGLWRLPVAGERPEAEVLLEQRYAITRYQVRMRVVRATARDRRERTSGSWFQARDLDAVAMPSPDRRVMDRLLALEREGDLWIRP